MTFDDEDIAMFRKNGVKIGGEGAKPFSVALSKAEPDALARIAKALEALLSREQKESKSDAPVIHVAAPTVTVQPPEVKFTAPEPERITKWKFQIERGPHGAMTEIIATAIK
jgi:hypothetical protein